MPNKQTVLAIIPARAGSKRIPNKNVRPFVGKPLVAYAIEQAKNNSLIDRVIVDTDSEEIATIAKKYGAEVPFLRPAELAMDTTQLPECILHMLEGLERDEKYVPDYVMILQTTSPLREQEDIDRVWEMMQKTDATTVLTVCPTHPRLYYVDEKQNIILANGSEKQSTNVQAWRDAYMLNGCFVYLVRTEALKREKAIITKKTKAIVCDRWRSVDLDMPEDWVVGEFLYENKERVKKALQSFLGAVHK